MKVLVGECTGKPARRIEALGWGRMWIARGRNIYTYPGEPWGLDTGAYRDWADNVPFDDDLFRRAVDKALAQPESPILAVVPDAPGNGMETLRMLDDWLPELERTAPDFPWYVAVQDGMFTDDLEPYIDRLAGVFLGGTSAYKQHAGLWCDWAHANGLKFHYARCGSLNKVAHAFEVMPDSIDSAFPMWTMERWNLFVETVTNGPIQQVLALKQARL